MKTLDLNKMTSEQLKAELDRRESEQLKIAKEQKRQFEMNKNNFVNTISERFDQLNSLMTGLKNDVIVGSNKIYERMFEINGKEPKDTKSFTLKNSNDTIKITVDRQDKFEFTEEATVHINAIKDIFREKFEARHKGMYNLLDGLLVKGSKGEYDPKILAKARMQVRALGDDNLINEFDKLDECQRVSGSASYCRLYTKDNKGRWQDISLQFSSL